MSVDERYAVAVAANDEDTARAIVEEKAVALIESWEKKNFGEKSGKLTVRKEVPNCSSIFASLGDSYQSFGVRDVPIGILGPEPSAADLERSRRDPRIAGLVDSIKSSCEINPLIVVIDGYSNGASGYVLEGAHRIAALDVLGAQSVPALVVFDESAPGIHRDESGALVSLETRFPQKFHGVSLVGRSELATTHTPARSKVR